MRKIITAIILGSGFLLATGDYFANRANISQRPADQAPATDLKLAEGNGHAGHGGMKMPATVGASTTTAQLTAGKIQAGTTTNLIIDIKAKNGQSIDKFTTFQTKLMHLIVVSDDLRFFDHIHPVYKQKGRFEVPAKFPQGGNYTLVSDYQPAGQSEQVSLMKVKVAGAKAAVPQLDFTKAKTVANTKVQLNNADNLKVGQEAMLVFKMQQSDGQPVTDLQPYLGELGHLVIIKNSAVLSRADYIHAHAAHGGNGEVHFVATFPKPGKYKLWGQFNRNGQIVTADFWVQVS